MYKIFAFFIVLSLCSCEKEIMIDWPDQNPSLVINCLFTSKNPFRLELSVTGQINDDTQTFIEDAEVVIHDKLGVFDTLIYTSNGTYIGDIIPYAGESYFLRIIHPDFDTLTAVSTIPILVYPDFIKLIDTAGIHQWGKPFSQIELSFTDPENIDNFYEIDVYIVDTNYDYSITEVIWPYSASDPVLTSEDILDYDPDTYVFSDHLFDGTSYVLKAPIGFVANYGNSELHFQFISASFEYYKFKKTLIKHLFNQGGRQLDMLIINAGNPLPVYSNINNGHGIFAGLSVYQTILK